MTDASAIFNAMRQSEMNDWVGGSDPEAVGDACVGILARYLTMNKTSRLLDFGCGVGRVLLSVLKNRPELGSITGFDIMPQVIRFCDERIAPAFPNSAFRLIQGRNDHYDQFIDAAGTIAPQSHDALRDEFSAAFTGAYAFSVFTHVEQADFGNLLGLVGALLEPGGELLFTCFLLTPYSRQAIEQHATLFPFGDTAYEADGGIFIGNRHDRLGFIAFNLSLVEQIVHNAGLVVTHVEHGSWTGAGFSGSLQDVVVCRRPRERVGDIQHVSIVPRPPRASAA
jgi:SAM-dependent methyltransferase